jgi:hypothetical protein
LDYNSRVIWNAWMHNCFITNARCIALFDYHDVIDTLSWEEACEVALDVALDVNPVPSILCSFGWHHCVDTFIKTNAWHPLIKEMAGFVFTDDKESKWQRLRVYQDPRMPQENIIRVSGNKADVARLLCMPSILFEDKERAVTQHEEAYPGNRGIIVKRGRKHRHRRLDGFTYCNDPSTWADSVTQFMLEFGGPAEAEMEADFDVPSEVEESTHTIAAAASVATSQPAGLQNALRHGVGVADSILKDMTAWYAARVGDKHVSQTWKHLHTFLFKKVSVPSANDLWWQASDPASETKMVVSTEFVALQVKQVIERREEFLRDNNLPLNTIMNDSQKDAFLAEVKAEYHGSPDQLRRQKADEAASVAGGKQSVAGGKKQRWSRECQRRGGTTQMFHLLSFSGRWDASFFDSNLRCSRGQQLALQSRPGKLSLVQQLLAV